MKGVFMASLLVASAAGSSRVMGQAPAAVGYRNVFSVNPLGIPFEYFSAEYERALTGLTSIGLTGSYVGFIDEGSYSTIEGKLRFYPNEEGPKGFSIGMSAGITRVSVDRFDEPDDSESKPSLGVIIDYNWLLGKTKRVVVGTGLGAKRIFGVGSDFDDDDIPLAYPTARFQVGLRF
jgi:hypothetical protein